MTLAEIHLQLQDLSCRLSYATKQDKHLSSDLQQAIASGLQLLAQLLQHSATFAGLETDTVKDVLNREASQNPGQYEHLTQLLDQLDELNSLLIQIRLMQDAQPEFVYKETIQPYNQV
jgi:hypothetical protein